MSICESEYKKAQKLSVDNFTPLSRTPWAGKQIHAFKSEAMGVLARECARIGESWEFSLDPDFPSRLSDIPAKPTLKAFIEANPQAALGNGHKIKGCELLVKTINAGTPLSLQVHPDDDDPNLGAGECGKPESWYILGADQGCGIYLGFKEGVTKEAFKRELLSEKNTKNIKEMLNFIEVKPGEYFNITPGTPHAIGPGVLLLEPQRVRMNSKGKTFRVWDWDRTYDQAGLSDPKGSPRDLHITQALELIDPETQSGGRYSNSLRGEATHASFKYGAISQFEYPGEYQTTIVTAAQTGTLGLKRNCYLFVMFIGGAGRIGDIEALPGQPFIVPAAADVSLHFHGPSKIAILAPEGIEAAL